MQKDLKIVELWVMRVFLATLLLDLSTNSARHWLWIGRACVSDIFGGSLKIYFGMLFILASPPDLPGQSSRQESSARINANVWVSDTEQLFSIA